MVGEHNYTQKDIYSFIYIYISTASRESCHGCFERAERKFVCTRAETIEKQNTAPVNLVNFNAYLCINIYIHIFYVYDVHINVVEKRSEHSR